MERERQEIRIQQPVCPFCHEDVTAEGLKQGCPSCMAWHHQACWLEAGGACSACGRATSHPPAPTDHEFARLLEQWPEENLVSALTQFRDEYDEPRLTAIERELQRRKGRSVIVLDNSESSGQGWPVAMWILILAIAVIAIASVVGSSEYIVVR